MRCLNFCSYETFAENDKEEIFLFSLRTSSDCLDYVVYFHLSPKGVLSRYRSYHSRAALGTELDLEELFNKRACMEPRLSPETAQKELYASMNLVAYECGRCLPAQYSACSGLGSGLSMPAKAPKPLQHLLEICKS
jgi:hypothetical protein